MELFVATMFWIHLAMLLVRIVNMTLGAYSKPTAIGTYAADTVITAGIAIWAGFALWWA